MSKIKDYLKLKKQVEQAKAQADKAEGALEQLFKTLKKDYGVNNLEGAKKKQKTLEKELNKLQKQFDNAYEEFKEKWGDKLNGFDENKKKDR